ncbi:uncharacterized protein LOC123721120 [Papilio machaon]|uniref:uncharacterized protein LOC123721120 n=1 Tax=Papilio machaon TaxID=76193 RepID=UPI001E663FD9|nr:uncharacterized protein LOC123721120 [Papilio machaon]
MTYIRAERIKLSTKSTHAHKIKRLLENNSKSSVCTQNQHSFGRSDGSVVNLSSHALSAEAQKVLSRGLNFAITPSRVPVESIVSSVESCLMRNKVPGPDAECLRQDISALIRRHKSPKQNITRQEFQALMSLRNNPNILVLPADKGNATVIIDTAEYEQKVDELVSDTSTYKKVNYNPTARVTSKLNKILSSLSDGERKRLRPLNPTPPKIYGLPKIHKPNWPLRPIVSQIDSPTYKCSRHMADFLQTLTGKTTSFIRDSTHFIRLLRDIRIQDDEAMVSFDVASLFTNVPVAETIDIIKQHLIVNNLPTEYISLIEFCLKSGYFLWRGDFYLQVDGVAMGSPIAPVVANIFMENFEKEALNSAPVKPRYWLRYVDDVFAIVSRRHIGQLLDHLNEMHPRIRFTTEEEKDGTLPFLDVLVKRESSGCLVHTVYRKPTHTDRYLKADSHHHPSYLSSVPRTLINRALRLCDPQFVESELTHVRRVLEDNGYKWRQSLRLANTTGKTRPQVVERVPAYLPYMRGVTDKIGHLLRRKYSIKTIFRPLTQIRRVLRSPKDRTPLDGPGVYEIPCDCGKSYIGETGRNINTRLTEHIRCMRKLDSNTSAVAEHALTSNSHYIRFDRVKVLARDKNFVSRKLLEAIEIRRRPNFNRDKGWSLSPAWEPVLLRPKQKNNEDGVEYVSDIVKVIIMSKHSPPCRLFVDNWLCIYAV